MNKYFWFVSWKGVIRETLEKKNISISRFVCYFHKPFNIEMRLISLSLISHEVMQEPLKIKSEGLIF